MNARQLILRHGEETERVVGSEVRLGGEGKALQVLKSAEVVRMNAMLVELGAHCRDGVVDAPQRDAEPARLQSCDLVAGKIDDVVLCPIYEKSELGQIRRFQKDDTWEELRRGQHYRYHLLNRCELTNLKREFTVVDLAKLFTLPLAFTQAHAKAQGNRIRLQPPYREHLAQSFARFYMRVGLPIDIPKFK